MFFTAIPTTADFCDEPRADGNCSSFKIRWHFNSNLGECLPFVYSGCEGNSNNFLDKEKCESVCKRKEVPDYRVCPAPMTSSSCIRRSSSYECSTNDDCLPGKRCCSVECCPGSCRKECVKPVLPG